MTDVRIISVLLYFHFEYNISIVRNKPSNVNHRSADFCQCWNQIINNISKYNIYCWQNAIYRYPKSAVLYCIAAENIAVFQYIIAPLTHTHTRTVVLCNDLASIHGYSVHVLSACYCIIMFCRQFI